MYFKFRFWTLVIWFFMIVVNWHDINLISVWLILVLNWEISIFVKFQKSFSGWIYFVWFCLQSMKKDPRMILEGERKEHLFMSQKKIETLTDKFLRHLICIVCVCKIYFALISHSTNIFPLSECYLKSSLIHFVAKNWLNYIIVLWASWWLIT